MKLHLSKHAEASLRMIAISLDTLVQIQLSGIKNEMSKDPDNKEICTLLQAYGEQSHNLCDKLVRESR